MRGNIERESLNKFKGKDEGEAIEYIALSFLAPSQKESNRPTNMGKGTRSLNHFIGISKICELYNFLLCVRVLRQKVLGS